MRRLIIAAVLVIAAAVTESPEDYCVSLQPENAAIARHLSAWQQQSADEEPGFS